MGKGSIEWQIAKVKGVRNETPRVRTLTLALPDWQPHQAGQHYDIRLTAEDGYQAQRSYSIASPPQRRGEVDLTVEKIDTGEVSPYLCEVLMEGDQIEVRGPIGGYFVWDGSEKPLLLIAGGSGMVPLMAILRYRLALPDKGPARLLYSSRTREDIIYYEELESLQAQNDGLKIHHTLTRSQPAGWKGYSRRIDQQMLEEVIAPLGKDLQAFLCGPTLLVESTADELVRVGIPPKNIKTERFGPSGPTPGG